MPRRGVLLAAAILALSGCGDELPTAAEESLLPVEVRSVELLLPFDAFVRDHRVVGGFGSPADVGFGLLADAFGDGLGARTLARFGSPPEAVTVVDPDTRETAVDSSLTYVGGRLVVRVDTAASTIPDEGVALSAGLPPRIWDEGTATWTLAADTVAGSEAWPEPGGGPVAEAGSAPFLPGDADTVGIALDSAAVAPLVDTARAGPGPGLRIAVEGPGARLRIATLILRVEIRPAIDPDTTVVRSVGVTDLTFIYEPRPGAPGSALRVGGVPAWRTLLELGLPGAVAPGDPYAPEGLREALEITAERVTFAELVLETERVPPEYEALDSLRLSARPVLAPERLPKSPLGGPVDVAPAPVAPAAFRSEEPATVRLPMTRFIRQVLEGETPAGDPAPETLFLVDGLEPSGTGYGAFVGPGGEGAPVLRLILTEGGGVTLP